MTMTARPGVTAAWRIGLAIAAVVGCGVVLAALLPRARESAALLLAQDDPAALADVQIGSALRIDPGLLTRQAEEALAAGDAELAQSIVELAAARGAPLAPELTQRVAVAVAARASAAATASRFATGLVTGEADDIASLSGTLTGDLFVFGDIRDVLREGKRLAMGEDADRLVLGLAGAGLAVTAATYVSAGGAAPLRAGLTLVKDARKVGRLGAGLTEWAARSARGVVDAPALRKAVADASLFHPSQTVGAVKAAFKAEKADALIRLAKDTGRIGEKAGTHGALDVLRIADGPEDVARAARLAETKGGQTRAIIRILGRSALFVAAGAFNLAWWLFGALMALVGVLASIKATTERATAAWIARRKRKAMQRAAEAAAMTAP